MRLKNLLPTLASCPRDAETLNTLLVTLEARQITTAEDLILYCPADDLLRSLPADLISKKDISRVYAEEHAHLSDLGPLPKLGVPSFDSVISFPTHGIVEFAGLAKSGRTLLVSHLTMRYLLAHHDTTATWIDTKGGFSPERTSQVTEHLVSSGSEFRNDDALARLHVAVSLDLPTTYDILETISDLTKSTIDGPRTRLIIIDCITPLLAPGLTSGSAKGHSLMDSFMLYLSSLCKEHGILVFLVNTVVRVSPPPVRAGEPQPRPAFKPSLGPTFTYLTDMSLYLKRVDSKPSTHLKETFAVKILKSRTSIAPLWCRYNAHDGIIIGSSV